MRWRIRNQIVIPLVAMAMVSLTAVAVINAMLAERRTRARVEQQLRQVVSVLSTSSFPLTNKVLQQMRGLSSAEFVLVDAVGNVRASSLIENVQLPAERTASSVEDVQLGTSARVNGRWYFHMPVALPSNSESRRSGVLHVLFPQDEYRRAWRQSFVPAIIVGTAMSLALAGVALTLASRMGRVIERLREEVVRIARGDFRGMELPKVDDEIRDLSVAVNRTAEMLADYEQQVRRSEQMKTLSVLGASLAHQLRNAVTGCRMALDLHAVDCKAEDSDECLDVAKRQLKLMESQLQRFLRIGKRPMELAKRNINLGDLVEELLPLMRPAALHAGVALDCRISSEVFTVKGDEEALSQVVLNVLLNAVEAAQQQGVALRQTGRVSIDVRTADDDTVEVVIDDSGPGPDEAVAATLFEPFVTSKAEGAGLGLAVAKEVVEAHGGSIAWTRENGMTRFCVSLPLISLPKSPNPEPAARAGGTVAAGFGLNERNANRE